MKRNPQGSRWRKLDNTGKLFPVITNENLSNVFRISVTLKEPITAEYLQQAVEETLPRFESFRVKLKRGFFWYYFETNQRKPMIEKEAFYPCRYIDPKSNQLFLFRVSYYESRINLEVFHALTDGLGASEFLKAITCSYLQKKYSENIDESNQPIGSESDTADEDSYLKNYKKTRNQSYSTKPSFQMKGEYLPLDAEHVIHGQLDLGQLKAVCKDCGATVTQYLLAVLIWSIYQVYFAKKQMKLPIGVNLPINLRSFFQSSTMANFFMVFVINYQSDQVTFKDILAAVQNQMKEKITKERMMETISYNVSRETKWFVRIVPLVIKWAAVNLIFRRNDRSYTTTLSNIGLIKVDPGFEEYIEDFRLMLGVSKRQPFKCGVCTFQDKLIFTFISVFKDYLVEKNFFEFLTENGVAVNIESNGAIKSCYEMGKYPGITYNARMWKNFINVFYAVLLALSACLGVVHYAVYQNHVWLAVTAVCISYVVFIMRYSIMRSANLAAKIMVQVLSSSVLIVALDWVTEYNGWSVNYGIPSLILFADIAIIFLILVNRLNWQSYFMYQIAVTIFSFVPMLLWALRLITHPALAIITLIFSVLILTLTVMLGDRSVKHELIRRFHL